MGPQNPHVFSFYFARLKRWMELTKMSFGPKFHVPNFNVNRTKIGKNQFFLRDFKGLLDWLKHRTMTRTR